MVAKDLEVGDLVWAKMKGFPAWPAKIIEPPATAKVPKQKKPHHYVYFFGSDNHAWILDDNIMPHAEHMVQLNNKKKSAAFQSAVEAIVSQSKNCVKKYKTSTTKAEKEKSVKNSDKATAKGKAIHVINHISKKRIDKAQDKKRLMVPKKARVVKESVKKVTRKRPSTSVDIDEESIEHYSEPYFKSRKTDDAGYVNLLSDLQSNIEYTHIPALEEEKDSLSGHSYPSASKHKYIERPLTPPFDVETRSQTLIDKHVKPTTKRIGFLGLGFMGRGIVKNLLNSGHYVTVWNRTASKCESFVKAGAKQGETPARVVAASDITFCCVSDPDAAKAVVFEENGVLKGLENCNGRKGYVEMTSVDPETSQAIAEAVSNKNGMYLEAPINGSKKQAEEGTLFILGAGDRRLFTECETCFHAMGQHAYYISCEVGNGSKLNLIISMLLGTSYAALAEAMALVGRAKLSQNDFLEILALGSLNCPAILDKGRSILLHNYSTNTPLKHMQKDLNLALLMGNAYDQPMPISAAANEAYKHAKLLRYADHDVCAVYQGSRC